MIESLIIAASLAAGIDPNLLKSIILVESTSCRARIVFHDGNSPSYGCGQVKYHTARFLAKKYKKTFHASDLFRLDKNLEYTALYLRYQLDRYEWKTPCAIEAYNKGSARKCNGRYVDKVSGLLK